MIEQQARLIDVLDRYDRLTVAVSGGVDSMTLAFLAHRYGGGHVSMAHAISPAVTPTATARVKRYAEQEGWDLAILDSGEFSDPSYRANPTDRCYFCKSCLYDTIQRRTGDLIASGANVDDLDDYRPGLKAAAERSVVHPFILAGIDKAGVRALARENGLADISDLPAQPCLASRIETGIGIEAADLVFVDQVERRLRDLIGPDRGLPLSLPAEAPTIRCRITHMGVVVEVAGLNEPDARSLPAAAAALCAENGRKFAGLRPYRRGSAFLGSLAISERRMMEDGSNQK